MASTRLSNPYTALLSASTFAGTSEITTAAFYPTSSARQSTIMIGSDQAGTVSLDIMLSDGTWYELTDATSTTVADQLSTITLVFPLKALRVRFTPDAAPGTITIDVTYIEDR